MNQQKDHTVLITISFLIGIVLTATIAIAGSIYNHNTDVARDKYYADHCQVVEKDVTQVDITVTKFKCSQ